MTMLSMETGWKTYVFKDTPAGAIEQKYNEDYKSDTIILIVEAGDPLSPEVLSYIDNLETDLRQQQNIQERTKHHRYPESVQRRDSSLIAG